MCGDCALCACLRYGEVGNLKVCKFAFSRVLSRAGGSAARCRVGFWGKALGCVPGFVNTELRARVCALATAPRLMWRRKTSVNQDFETLHAF